MSRQRPRRLPSDVEDKLRDTCPGDLFTTEYEAGSLTCCTEDVLDFLSGLFTLYQAVYTSCASCGYNFKNLYCILCKPAQARTYRTSGETPAPDAAGTYARLETRRIDIVLLRSQADAAYVGCNHVGRRSTLTPSPMEVACTGVGLGNCRNADEVDNRVFIRGTTENFYHIVEGLEDTLDLAEFGNIEAALGLGSAADTGKLPGCREAAPYPEDSQPCSCEDCGNTGEGCANP